MRDERPRLSDCGLRSERLLWPRSGAAGNGPSVFENEIAALERQLGLTTFGKPWAWAQTHSMWPDLFGLSCCTIEMMAVVGARYDIARFGMEFFRASPRQADLMIVPGRVSHKMARPLRQIYDQMLEPKWVIAMSACASSGGMFNNYATVQGVDRIIPVDIYIPGCPPRPEALLEGITRLHGKIRAGIPPRLRDPKYRRVTLAGHERRPSTARRLDRRAEAESNAARRRLQRAGVGLMLQLVPRLLHFCHAA